MAGSLKQDFRRGGPFSPVSRMDSSFLFYTRRKETPLSPSPSPPLSFPGWGEGGWEGGKNHPPPPKGREKDLYGGMVETEEGKKVVQSPFREGRYA